MRAGFRRARAVFEPLASARFEAPDPKSRGVARTGELARGGANAIAFGERDDFQAEGVFFLANHGAHLIVWNYGYKGRASFAQDGDSGFDTMFLLSRAGGISELLFLGLFLSPPSLPNPSDSDQLFPQPAMP